MPTFRPVMHVRSGTLIPAGVNRIGIILASIGMNRTRSNREYFESDARRDRRRGDMAECELWALRKDALGLLDAFAAEQLTVATGRRIMLP